MLTAKRLVAVLIATIAALVVIGAPMLRHDEPDTIVAAQLCLGIFVGEGGSDVCVPLP